MSEWSRDCREVLELLTEHHNVLIRGAPGTGKTRLLNEIAAAFAASTAVVATSGVPIHERGSRIPIPSRTTERARGVDPAPERTDRKVFRTVFHQNMRHRDFISGLVPRVTLEKHGGTAATEFVVQEGSLVRASEHAKLPSGASLLIIDEINRGPAVQLFGGALVSFEADKRLRADGTRGPQTSSFELLKAPNGELTEYELPFHLYTVAAMNEADTSVEPLDVAFLRRWRPYSLQPDVEALKSYFNVENLNSKRLPNTPTSAAHVYEAAILAWQAVNTRISRGRGPEFQIGHGVLIGPQSPPTGLDPALNFLHERWVFVQAHIAEVFFGDTRAIAEVLGVRYGTTSTHPYVLSERVFADEVRFELEGPPHMTPNDTYALFRAIVTADQAGES